MTETLHWYAETTGGVRQGDAPVHPGCGALHLFTDMPAGTLKAVRAELPWKMEADERLFMNGYQTWTYSPELDRNGKLRGTDHIPGFLRKKYAFDRYGPMLREHAGCIVNVSSMWGLRGASCEVTYSATKAALIALTRSLAAELAPTHIRVNCVAPGVIKTDMLDALPSEVLPQLAEETPLRRLGRPEDIAAAVSYLASDDASFVTGQVLTVDGGFIL